LKIGTVVVCSCPCFVNIGFDNVNTPALGKFLANTDLPLDGLFILPLTAVPCIDNCVVHIIDKLLLAFAIAVTALATKKAPPRQNCQRSTCEQQAALCISFALQHITAAFDILHGGGTTRQGGYGNVSMNCILT